MFAAVENFQPNSKVPYPKFGKKITEPKHITTTPRQHRQHQAHEKQTRKQNTKQTRRGNKQNTTKMKQNEKRNKK